MGKSKNNKSMSLPKKSVICVMLNLTNRQVSKLDQLVTVQGVSINTQRQMVSQQASLMNHGPIVMATLQRKTAASCGHKQDIGAICGDKLWADQTFHS
jgi:hypothetical protein